MVVSRTADVLWQADALGAVTGITLCRPALPERAGGLDEAEIAQVELLRRKAVLCAKRFSAGYHVRTSGGAALRNFLIQAIPIFSASDEVLYWSGHATEVDRFADAGTRFISKATAVLSSSLSRSTIVNRLIEASLEEFADLCAVHMLQDDGSLSLEGFADRRADVKISPETLAQPVGDALRARQPALLLSGEISKTRSGIIVPIFVGTICVGSLTFLESERRSSFAARELDIAMVVARQLAMALENIRTFEREQHATDRFRFLARITERLFTTLDSKKPSRYCLMGSPRSLPITGLPLS